MTQWLCSASRLLGWILENPSQDHLNLLYDSAWYGEVEGFFGLIHSIAILTCILHVAFSCLADGDGDGDVAYQS